MNELEAISEALYQWTERHQTAIKIATAIIFIVGLALSAYIEQKGI
jgi:hypothetical protein